MRGTMQNIVTGQFRSFLPPTRLLYFEGTRKGGDHVVYTSMSKHLNSHSQSQDYGFFTIFLFVVRTVCISNCFVFLISDLGRITQHTTAATRLGVPAFHYFNILPPFS